jgi:hypothetical protein
MRKFAAFTSFLLISTVIVALILDYSYTYVFKRSHPRSKVQYIFQMKDVEIDLAFFGSSRTENHIDCELVSQLTGKSCLNLGIAGATIDDMFLIMQIAAERNIRFNRVYLQVDYSYNHTGFSRDFIAKIVPYINEPIVKKNLARNSDFPYYVNIPFYRYMDNEKVVGFREVMATLIGRKPKIDYSNGYNPKYGIGNNLAGEFPTYFKEENYTLSALQQFYRNLSTEIIFFIAPYCKNVKNREAISILEKRLPGMLNYISIFDDQNELFYNCGHLNHNGASKFTKRLLLDSGEL